MKCPFCGNIENRVLDTRVQKQGEVIRRRRECFACKGRFTTVETVQRVFPLVIKKDGRRETFSKEKIFKGVQAACQKRPVSIAQMEQIVDRISVWALEQGEKEISSNNLGHQVMAHLKNLDDVAYVRFASVYRTFTDIQEFLEVLGEDQIMQTRERVRSKRNNPSPTQGI